MSRAPSGAEAFRRAQRRARSLAAVACVLLAPAAAWGEAGREAFARQDYAAAAALWRAEAADGSAEAKFGLGLIHDLGLGVPRSSAVALRWYLEAAGDGVADAQFNVAVMFDAGTGVPRDPAAAALWYARAAANGHARAQYNLGLLYENGIGVPRDADLARAWFEAARPALAAAADRLAGLPPPGRGRPAPAPPRPVMEAVVGPPDARRAELVWTAAGGGGFRVELARGPDPAPARAPADRPAAAPADAPAGGGVLLSLDVDRTAVAIDLPPDGAGLRWRVGRRDGAGGASAWSAWRDLPEGPAGDEPPLAGAAAPRRLTIHVNAGDDLAGAFAAELTDAYARGGVEVTVRRATRPAAATTVEYRFGGDADFAAAVADFLPGLGLGSAVRAPDLGTGPGEVTLRLVGGPRPPAAPPGGEAGGAAAPQPSGPTQTSRTPGGGTGL